MNIDKQSIVKEYNLFFDKFEKKDRYELPLMLEDFGLEYYEREEKKQGNGK